MIEANRRERIVSTRVKAIEQEFLLSWKPHCKDNNYFSIWCSSESLARIFVDIANRYNVRYTVFPAGIALKLPMMLLPFQLPFKKAYVISERERRRRSERFRRIMHLGWEARRKKK